MIFNDKFNIVNNHVCIYSATVIAGVTQILAYWGYLSFLGMD